MNGVAGPSRPVPGLSAFLTAYPQYGGTACLDGVRAEDYDYLDSGGHVYLDYAGSGLPAQWQLRAGIDPPGRHAPPATAAVCPMSPASSRLVDRTRERVLAHFGASPDEYTVIFTGSATGACRMVGEAYPFRAGTRFVQLVDNHNAVNGIREFARAQGAAIETVGLAEADLRGDDDAMHAALRSPASRFGMLRRRSGETRGLLAYPAQSNFTGVRHPLGWIEAAHAHGYDVLLDAAAHVPTDPLDLSRIKPDFMPVSWAKFFGYPTALGCLVARREALARLERPWFSTRDRSSGAIGDWFQLTSDDAAARNGAAGYRSIPDIEVGLYRLGQIGADTIRTRVRCLTGWLLDRLTSARHSGGAPLVRVYGPADLTDRGGTVAFSFLDEGGLVVDERLVARDAAAHGITLRTGCFANPGAAESAFAAIQAKDRSLAFRPYPDFAEDHLDGLAAPSGGAVRVSIGPATDLADIARFLEFGFATYLDPTRAARKPVR
ncbi:aminotransferase class V-fold PLP-dependent enzyme [Murinocardiopsis flavida]|nr:aminotransferase class V-fold PLP-dependent enzyme [Murinocardiopsis flavida]